MTVFLESLISSRSKAVFIVALVVMAASCSFKTLYNQLDYLIPSYVEGMVSLDGMLEEKVEQRSLVLINWHRIAIRSYISMPSGCVYYSAMPTNS